MQAAYYLLFGYIAWMIILFVGMFIVRYRALKSGMSFRDLTPSNEKISDFAYRLARAHANCFENLPILLAVVFVAYATQTLDVINSTAYVFLFARIGQSCAHLYSGRARVTMVRGIFFVIQVCLIIYWMVGVLLNTA